MVMLKMVRSLSICEITKCWKISCHNDLGIGSSNDHLQNGSFTVHLGNTEILRSISCPNHLKIGSSNGHVENGLFTPQVRRIEWSCSL